MMTVPDLLGIERRGWEWYPYRDLLRIGEMTFVHDVGRAGVNTARQSLQDLGDNIVVGHAHRAQVSYAGTIGGRPHVAVCSGWLGDYKKIDYYSQARALREWQHGFTWITQTSDGVSWCNFIPIIDGRCIVDGKLITGRG
jgi:hypothetical protein